MSSIELSHPHAAVRKPPIRPLRRLRVLVHRGRLDRLIAEGRDPTTDPRLALRAAQLAQPALRASLARSLLNALRSVDNSATSRMPSPHIPVDAASVRVCSPELYDLAHALNDVDPRVRGVAIARVLLTDGGSPLYEGPPDRLRKVLVAAHSALYLDPGSPGPSETYVQRMEEVRSEEAPAHGGGVHRHRGAERRSRARR